MPKEVRKPSMIRHSSGQARVRLRDANGKLRDHYLGPWGSEKAQLAYDDLMREWTVKNGNVAGYVLKVEDLGILYYDFAAGHFLKDGKPTSEVDRVRSVVRHLVAVHGRTPIRKFGPLALQDVRRRMIDAGLCRRTVNDYVWRIKRIFAWAVENEHCDVAVHQALQCVKGLTEGRTEARETAAVKPVPEGTVTVTLEKLPAVVAAMVKLQLVTGARPSEVCILRPCDVTIGRDGVWCYRPSRHKNQHRGKERRIYIGPQGQAVLRPFLGRDPEAYCFTPAESEAERNANRKAKRRSPRTPSQAARKPRGRKLRDHYTKDSYARAVARACIAAEVAPWSPNQLRHSRATILEERFGTVAAQLVLGHADPRTTAVYAERAERDFAMAARIQGEVG